MANVKRALGSAVAATALVALVLWLALPGSTDEPALPRAAAAGPAAAGEAPRPTATDTEASRSRALAVPTTLSGERPAEELGPVPDETAAASGKAVLDAADGPLPSASAPSPLRAPSGSGTPIAWVRSGERVEMRASPGGRLIGRLGDETEFGSPTVFAISRRRGDWIGVPTPLRASGRLGWVKLDPRRLRTGTVGQSIVVDLSQRSARLLRGDRVVHSWAVTIGAPGSETPTGSFAVTDTFRGGLNPAYGCCAVALTARQPDVPSGWVGGDRIAFHGTSGLLGVAASHGCLRSADRDVSFLVESVALGTPVRIRK